MKMSASRNGLTALILLTGMHAHAQTVFIPDTNLWSWFNEYVPGMVDANGYMDTTVAEPLGYNHAELDVTWGPSDLTGLQYLTSLDVLEVNYVAAPEGEPQFIPAWPPALVELTVSGYQGNQLPLFPSTIQGLSIGGCPTMTEIQPLPATLWSFGVRDMPLLTSLPALPAQVMHLNCGPDLPQLTALPELPVGIWSMALHDLEALSTLPILPEGFLSLEMSAVPMLTELPTLPMALQTLRLTSGVDVPIETLPSGLVELQLVGQSIAGWNQLPMNLEILYLSDLGQLQSLPTLPATLNEIYLFDLPLLTCMPQLPDTTMLTIWSTGLTCLPNHPVLNINGAYESYVEWWGENHLPLCTVLNSICPNNNGVITGHVYHDVDGDGVRDPGEGGWASATLAIAPGGLLAGVDSTGYFEVGLPDGGYTFSAQANSAHAISISPGFHLADLLATEADSLNDFGVVLAPGIADLELDLTVSMAFVPGATRDVVLTCRNSGSTTIVGSVTLEVGDGAVITSTDPAPTLVNDSATQWMFGPMPAGAVRVIHTYLLTDTGAVIGMPIELSAELLPTIGDTTPANNTVTLVDTVLASYDPNDKRVEPTSLTPAQVAAGSELEYTIRFQNTGTYQADRVIITDTLSADLQWSTMRLMSSSHPCTWTILGNGVLRFTFDPIVLPDSTSDEPNSHGFVKFAMKPSTSLLNGESIGNVANIYFDYNEPVITNEAVFTVDESSSIRALDKNDLRVWPNPADDELWVEGTGLDRIEILDVTGRVVRTEVVRGSRVAVDVSGSLHGAYVLRAHGPSGWRTAPFLKR